MGRGSQGEPRGVAARPACEQEHDHSDEDDGEQHPETHHGPVTAVHAIRIHGCSLGRGGCGRVGDDAEPPTQSPLSVMWVLLRERASRNRADRPAHIPFFARAVVTPRSVAEDRSSTDDRPTVADGGSGEPRIPPPPGYIAVCAPKFQAEARTATSPTTTSAACCSALTSTHSPLSKPSRDPGTAIWYSGGGG